MVAPVEKNINRPFQPELPFQSSSKKSVWHPYSLWGLLLLCSLGMGVCFGAYPIQFSTFIDIIQQLWTGESKVDATTTYLLWQIRLPRVLLGAIVGASLAVSGASVQGLFRNPIADPSLIGINSGAMLFAVIAIVMANQFLSPEWLEFLGHLVIAVSAFTGCLLSSLLVYRLGTFRGKTQVGTMLLAGIAITALSGALTGLMVYLSSEQELRDITFWSLGSLGGGSWPIVIGLAVVNSLAIALLISFGRQLDILALGEAEAQYLGVNLQRLKVGIFLGAALLIGCSVAITGLISFVALVVPHLIRLIHRPNHRDLLIYSLFLGAILMVFADLIARIVIAPAELPIGILTATLGAPFFLWLLMKSKDKFSLIV